MSPAWIRPRIVTKSDRNPRGKTYQVLYRRGGRGYRIESAGTFKTDKEARTRRDVVAGWLAQGLNPKLELAKLAEHDTPVRTETLRDRIPGYEASRIDLSDNSVIATQTRLKRVLSSPLADMDPHAISLADVQDLVTAWGAELKPSSVPQYISTLRQLLDYCDVDPNPARDARLRLPRIVHEEIVPPTADHFLAILNKAADKWLLPFVTIEQTAMTSGEIGTLTWSDVDVAGNRFRLRVANVKGQFRARARWVQVPEWLMAVIEDTCPLEDRLPNRRVFPAYTVDGAGGAMARACRTAKIPVYSPHDLRHRRISLWHGQGVPHKELAGRAGHSKASMTLDVYSHVMPLDEVPMVTLERLLVMPR